MTLRSSDLQSDSDLDSIRNSCDVFGIPSLSQCWSAPFGNWRLVKTFKPNFGQDIEAWVWSSSWKWILVEIRELRFSRDCEAEVWFKFWNWILNKTGVRTCVITWNQLIWWEHSTFGSSVPLAIFLFNIISLDTFRSITSGFRNEDVETNVCDRLACRSCPLPTPFAISRVRKNLALPCRCHTHVSRDLGENTT